MMLFIFELGLITLYMKKTKGKGDQCVREKREWIISKLDLR